MKNTKDFGTSTSQIPYASTETLGTGLESFTTAESIIGFPKNRDYRKERANYNDMALLYKRPEDKNSLRKECGDRGITRAVRRFSPPLEKLLLKGGSRSSCMVECGSTYDACPPDFLDKSPKSCEDAKRKPDYCDDCYCCQSGDKPVAPRPYILKEIKNRCNPLKFEPFFTSKYSCSRTLRQPLWMESCGRKLTFFAYYQEPIPESALENYRIHQCSIHYYIEDGSFEVYEKKTFDPGFTQGLLIRRHKIPLPHPCEDSFFDIDHIEVGCEVTFYGKTFYICGCDAFTRQYVNRVLCKPVMPDQELPEDPYTVYRHDQVTSLFARPAKVNACNDKLKKFLHHNQKVLRFWGYWDDRCNFGGLLRKFVIHYYLEDDTIEIKEIAPPNSGLDNAPTFFQRSKLRKNIKDAVIPPDRKPEAMLVLNLAGGTTSFLDHTYLSDRLCPGVEEQAFYSDQDLAIGAVINVYGRAFVLTDCDESTKIYYKEMYGLENFTALVIDEGNKPLPRMKTPPHNGIGNEEDTRINWDRIQIAPPRHFDLKKMIMEKDILGFGARFYNALRNVNKDRRFVINFHMGDGSIQIFEKEHPNTGIQKGCFLARARVIKSGSWNEPNDPVEYFSPSDFFVGNILNINKFNFQLTCADESTLNYMEKHSQIFLHSNTCNILNKLREAVGPIQAVDLLALFTKRDSCLQGVQSYEDFSSLIKEITKCSLSEHEIITLGRAFKVVAKDPGPDWATLQSVIQTELRRFNFDKQCLQKIEYILRYHDPCRQGLVDRQHLNSALKGSRMPVEKLIIDFLVKKFPASDSCDRVNYCEVMKFLNFVDNPAQTAKPSSLACVLKYLEPKAPVQVFCVNYRALLESICPNFKCSLPQLCCPSEAEGECCEGENSPGNENYFPGEGYTENFTGRAAKGCNDGIDQVEMDRQRLCPNADEHRQQDHKAFCTPPSQSDCSPWFQCDYPSGYGC